MSYLCLSTYIQIVQKGLKDHDGQESASVFLLESINGQQCTADHGCWTSNLGSTKISRLMSRQDPVPDGIKTASNFDEVISGTLKYFGDNVVPDIKPHTKDDTLDALAMLIEGDKTISDKKKESLLTLYKNSDLAGFLAQTFLYAVNKPNKLKKSDVLVDAEDVPLLAEANYECPIEHVALVDEVKGKPVKKYRIVQIFPESLDEKHKNLLSNIFPIPKNLNSKENLIALSTDAAESYLMGPTSDEYCELYKIKRKLVANYNARMAVNKIELEDNIRAVIGSLIDLSSAEGMEKLSYDALKLEEKFTPENFILKNETKNRVVQYYKYIEVLFSDSGSDFDIIANEVRLGSRKLEKSGMPQEDVVYNLAEWIREKSGMGENSRLACNIVVAFFIQNCEVFHK